VIKRCDLLIIASDFLSRVLLSLQGWAPLKNRES